MYASTSKENGFPQENTGLEEELEEFYEKLPSLEHTGHEGEIDNVLFALENGTKPLIQGEDGRLTVELITAIYKAGFSNAAVKLPLEKDDPYYTAKGIQKHVKHFYEKSASVENFADVGITVGSSTQREKQGR